MHKLANVVDENHFYETVSVQPIPLDTAIVHYFIRSDDAIHFML